jgi:hypothetical protein
MQLCYYNCSNCKWVLAEHGSIIKFVIVVIMLYDCVDRGNLQAITAVDILHLRVVCISYFRHCDVEFYNMYIISCMLSFDLCNRWVILDWEFGEYMNTYWLYIVNLFSSLCWLNTKYNILPICNIHSNNGAWLNSKKIVIFALWYPSLHVYPIIYQECLFHLLVPHM